MNCTITKIRADMVYMTLTHSWGETSITVEIPVSTGSRELAISEIVESAKFHLKDCGTAEEVAAACEAGCQGLDLSAIGL